MRTALRTEAAKVVAGITITHPSKPLWPDGGDGKPVTKLQLAQYFETMASWMMPHISHRPCSILRAPDGILGKQFLQRHATVSLSAHLDKLKVAGDRAAYVQINSTQALEAVAQAGGIELHPWNCSVRQPERPGRLVFDFDPADDVNFADVVQGALLFRRYAETLGLAPFVKTTGGKGLHIVVPLDAETLGRTGWPVAKAVARAICVAMSDKYPDRFVVNMARKRRNGRIFLDYLRNDRTATAVAPLSPRARVGAAVSMPLTWSQMTKRLDPKRFTIRTAPALLSQSNAWHDYNRSGCSLHSLAEQFGL